MTRKAQRWMTERLAVDKAQRMSMSHHIAALQNIRAYLLDEEQLDEYGVPVLHIDRVDQIIAESCGYEVPE